MSEKTQEQFEFEEESRQNRLQEQEAEKGQFESLNLQISPNAYFPLFNFAGIMSCVTPELKGDTKTGQNSFLTPPIVSEELPHTRYSRNFWIKSNETVWSATGCADDTKTNEKKNIEKSSVKAGILYFDLTRNHKKLGLIATTRCFVPFNNDTVEIIYFSVQNVSKSKKIAFTPFFAQSSTEHSKVLMRVENALASSIGSRSARAVFSANIIAAT